MIEYIELINMTVKNIINYIFSLIGLICCLIFELIILPFYLMILFIEMISKRVM